MKKDFNVIIVGLGLAGTTAAMRMTELGVKDIAMFGTAGGASRHVNAFNLSTRDNTFGDSPTRFAEDILEVGCHVQDPDKIYEMTGRSEDVYEMLLKWGCEFSKNPDGSLVLRQTCGSSRPRTLCTVVDENHKNGNIGANLLDTVHPKLREAGVKFFEGMTMVRLLSAEGRIVGVKMQDAQGNLKDYYAPVVMAAWGGIGRLIDGHFEAMGPGTGHPDLNGAALGAAVAIGAKVVDMEFLEYEPVKLLGGVKGGVATTMLATGQPDHGIAIRNKQGERFLFNVRPEGEAGVPKAVLLRENAKQVLAGNGDELGGCYMDFSAVEREGCSDQWKRFFATMDAQGIDLQKTWIPFGWSAHSHSGGLLTDRHYETSIKGLYAAGEAIGGSQGGDRAGGMGGGQAAMTGFICGESIAEFGQFIDELPEDNTPYHEDKEVCEKYLTRARAIADPAFPVFRNGKDLEEGIAKLDELLKEEELKKSDTAYNSIVVMKLVLNGALLRKESRGVHNRVDYPEENPEYAHGIVQQI
ncbi:MAG: FAD-binding protein [Erysipelotrichaceae bacterium]|nr:FAD-binding protein [Erysipelotrichaceae bacterium]